MVLNFSLWAALGSRGFYVFQRRLVQGSQLCNNGLFTHASGIDCSECERCRTQSLPKSTQAQPNAAGLSMGGVQLVHQLCQSRKGTDLWKHPSSASFLCCFFFNCSPTHYHREGQLIKTTKDQELKMHFLRNCGVQN